MTLDRIRNFGIIAHIDAGKTTTTERILYYSRRIHKVGNVDEGTTTTDWYVLEQQRGISIFSAAVTCEWRDHMINVIDTPGHVDFTAEVERSLRVLDGAVVVFDGVKGVEAQSETVWRQANRYGIPRIAFINKMDRPGADFDHCLETIRERLAVNPVAVTLPLGSAANFRGVIDLIRDRILSFEGERGEEVVAADVPEEMREETERRRHHLLEAVADYDDELLSNLLDGTPPGAPEVLRALRKATLAGKVVPAYAGSSLHHQGVQPVLDGVIDLLPSPLDRPVIQGTDPSTGKPEQRDLRKDSTLSAIAFKTETDPHGELTYVRLYTGRIRAGEGLYNPRLERHERTTRLFRMFAHSREAIDVAGPGEIVGVIGLKQTVTGDTLSDKKRPILLELPSFPEPVVDVAIEPKSSADKDKLDEVLKRLAKDDPTFKVSVDTETGQTVLHCMGELHAEVLHYRITTDFRVPSSLGKPRVAYRETITAAAAAKERAVIRVGEKSLFGHVVAEIVPDPSAVTPVFESRLAPELDKALRRFLPAIREGLLSAAGSGPIAGYPMTYVRCVLVGGSVTPESAEAAYSAAAVQAFRAALAKVQAVLLEPHMSLEVTVPDDYVGDIINDLNMRGAEIVGMESVQAAKVVRGHVALSQMFGYASRMRSLTQGRGSYTLEPFEYRPVPPEALKRFGM
ncbi:MAG: elongation factor G [Planctomycetes bacterium]|nr:elongation factor G [Planctomycetota bacterium]